MTIIARFFAALTFVALAACGDVAQDSPTDTTPAETTPDTSSTDGCDRITCEAPFVCIDAPGTVYGVECGCPTGTERRGESCASPDQCNDAFCSGNGVCSEGEDGFECTCGPEHAGEFCGECADGYRSSGRECVKEKQTPVELRCTLSCSGDSHCAFSNSGEQYCADGGAKADCGPGFRSTTEGCVRR